MDVLQKSKITVGGLFELFLDWQHFFFSTVMSPHAAPLLLLIDCYTAIHMKENYYSLQHNF